MTDQKIIRPIITNSSCHYITNKGGIKCTNQMQIKPNSKMIALYRRLLMPMGYKIKSSVYGIPTLNITMYRKMCRDIVAGRLSNIFNDDSWGLGEENLVETLISLGEYE